MEGETWKVLRMPTFDAWHRSLDTERATQVAGALRYVEARGPLLGRPHVDSIKGSRVHNLKELRLNHGVRVLFAFDPNRHAVMLVGGDKTGSWDRWYVQKIRVAEKLYTAHLQSIGKGDRCLSPGRVGRTKPERGR